MGSSPTPEVRKVFNSYPKAIRDRLYVVRALIRDLSKSDETIGPITETLKWNEPAYLTEKTKAGSTVRLGWKASSPDTYAIYFNCQTTIVKQCQKLFPELAFVDNRALVLKIEEDAPIEALSECLKVALTYHATKKR